MTERPPITSARRADPVVIAVRMTEADLKALTSVEGGIALTPATWSLIVLASLSRSVPGLA